jgi:hypothetical protein
VQGRVSRNGFALIKHTPFFHNSFRTEASGRFVLASGGGTEIPMRIGMSRWTALFITLWLGFLLAFVLVALAASLGELVHTSGHPAFVILAPTGMAAFGVALMAFGRWLSRNEGPFLVRFLREELEAEAVLPESEAELMSFRGRQ